MTKERHAEHAGHILPGRARSRAGARLVAGSSKGECEGVGKLPRENRAFESVRARTAKASSGFVTRWDL